MIVSVQDEARLHGEALRLPCAECGRPVADPLDLVHVACERTARADALHALLSGPAPAPGRLPARDAARLLALIGEPLAGYRVTAAGDVDGGLPGGTARASADRAAVAALARRTGAVAVVPFNLVVVDVDGKDAAGNLVPGLEAARVAGLRAAGIDPATAVAVRSQSGTGLHLWWRAGAHRWPGKVAKLPLPGGRTVELYARDGAPGGRCAAWLAASTAYLSAPWSRLTDAPEALRRRAVRPPAAVPRPAAAPGAAGGSILDRKAAELRTAPQGDRHAALARAAYATAGLDPDARRRELAAAMVAAGVPPERAAREVPPAIRSADRKAAPYRGRRSGADRDREALRRLLRAPSLSAQVWDAAKRAPGGARWLPRDVALRLAVPVAVPPAAAGARITGGPGGVTLEALDAAGAPLRPPWFRQYGGTT